MTANAANSRLRPRWILLAAAFGLALAMGFWYSPLDWLLIWHWRVRLATADDARAAQIVEHIAGQGEVGLEALADLVGSARSSVVEAARRSIQKELDRWPWLPAAERTRRGLSLASALALRVEQFNPAQRRIASHFAVRILRETSGERGPQRGQLVTVCEQVIRTAMFERRQALLAAAAGAASGKDNLGRNDDELDDEPLDPLAHLPAGGGLPLDTGHAASPADASGEDENQKSTAAPVDADEPNRLAAEAAANQAAQTAAPTVDDDPRLLPTSEQRSDKGEPPGADPTDTLRWMHALHSVDLELRARAEDELERQGFKALQLELARQLTDPDPRIRQALAESLPAMPGIDAHVWLVWLSRDEKADVRLAAMSVMATTADPNVIRRLEQMARTDPDTRIQRAGERLLGQRDGQRHSTAGRSGAPSHVER